MGMEVPTMGTVRWVQGGCRTRAWGAPIMQMARWVLGTGTGVLHCADKVGAGHGHGRCLLTWMVRWVLGTGMEVPTM